jgi:hypothetical protein
MPYSNLRCTPLLKGHFQKKKSATKCIPLSIPLLFLARPHVLQGKLAF